jgi:hypothetical protein
MTGIEFMLLFSFLVCVFAFFLKLGNIISSGKLYGLLVSWLGFIGFFFFYMLLWVFSMYELSIFGAVFLRVASFLLVIVFLLHFFEVFFLIKRVATNYLEGGRSRG